MIRMIFAVFLGTICLCACVPRQGYAPSSTIYAEPRAMANYALTQAQARAAVFVYCKETCEHYAKIGTRSRLPYRATFKRALGGDFEALHTIFTDGNYHSGDNEDWIDIQWAILHAVGDRPFAAFLDRLTPPERNRIFLYLRYSVLVPDQEFWPYFERHFPLVSPRYRRYVDEHRRGAH